MDADTVAVMITIVVSVLGSSLMTVRLLLQQMNHLDKKFDTKFDGLNTKFDTKFDGLNTKVTALDTKVTALDTRVTGLDTKVTALDTRSNRRIDRLEKRLAALDDVKEGLARIEGYLMAPGGFRPYRSRSSAAEGAAPEDQAADHPEAG